MDGFKPLGYVRFLLLLSWIVGAAFLSHPVVLEAKTIPFPQMEGWQQPEKPQFFSPETLYEYINGAADLYLTYEFQDLNVAEYRDAKKASVTIEIYRHGNPIQAFGIYSQERLANARFLDIGAQGYQEPMVLNFVTGPYYVKINGYETGAEDEKTLISFGRKVEAILGGKSSLPAILSSFPQEGKKKNSEKFISKNFLGYSFLHSGFTADYEAPGKKFKIFIIQGKDPADCKDMMEKYLARTKNEANAAEGPYRLKDPYHGELELFWKGSHIWGVLDLDDPGLRSRYLKEVEMRLQK